MKRLLVIEDELIYQRMIAHALRPMGLEIVTANDGEQGLQLASATPPDIIISDVMMPNVGGFEVARRLRRDPRFAQVPILILTSQVELSDKLAAFEAGADEYMSKPFEPAELIARVSALLRRGEAAQKAAQAAEAETRSPAEIIAVHSLRGGIGCSSAAVNLAIGLRRLWNRPTLVLDMVLSAGQVALMLNGTLKRTWVDITHIKPEDLDWEALRSIIGEHESGVSYVAAPTFPAEAERFTPALFQQAFKLLCSHFEYVVVDLPHDFGETTIQVLDSAHTILMLLAPELSSARASLAALDTYRKLDYPPDKVKLVLNYTFESKWLSRKKIEQALNHSVEIVIPYAGSLFVDAINVGRPLLYAHPQEESAEALEYMAVQVSKPEDRANAPAPRTAGWQQIGKLLLGKG